MQKLYKISLFIAIISLLYLSTPIVYGADFFNVNLRLGSRGNEVKKVQEFLADEGLYTGLITGNYYSLTLRAIKAFQLREGVTRTGYWGPLTRTKANLIVATNSSEAEAEADADSTPIATPDPLPIVTAPVADLCMNIEGAQTSIPAGMYRDNGNCFVKQPEPVSVINPTPLPPQTDFCNNIDGVQSSVPANHTWSNGICTPIPAPTPTPVPPPPPVIVQCPLSPNPAFIAKDIFDTFSGWTVSGDTRLVTDGRLTVENSNLKFGTYGTVTRIFKSGNKSCDGIQTFQIKYPGGDAQIRITTGCWCADANPPWLGFKFESNGVKYRNSQNEFTFFKELNRNAWNTVAIQWASDKRVRYQVNGEWTEWLPFTNSTFDGFNTFAVEYGLMSDTLYLDNLE